MKIKKKNWFIKLFTGSWNAPTSLAPLGIYLAKEDMGDEVKINHAKIHWRQQRELLYIFSYLWYFIEWFMRMPINKVDAFLEISLEKEARDNQENLKYLETRKPYAWLKYLKK